MNKKGIILAFGLWLITVGVCQGVGRGTSPPSSGPRSGLIRSPNPIDRSSNLVVTGNIAGGKHFRGIVPYSSTNYYSGSMPSSSLDSFLRYSAGSTGELYRGGYESFYSPSRTVTSTRAGMRRVFKPQNAGVGIGVTGGLGRAAEIGRARLVEPSFVRPRPLSRLPQQIKTAYIDTQDNLSMGRRLSVEQSQKQMEEFRFDLQKAAEKAEELARKIAPEDRSQPQKARNIQRPARSTTDIFDLMTKQLKAAREQAQAEAGAEAEAGEDQADTPEQVDEAELVDLEQIVKAKSILGEHKTFASFSEDRFNQYMRAAEVYLAEGKYYRAADCYTIASIYKPEDPLAYAGKSHALFAAGEYMSSAHFLARTLEIFPEYAGLKIDIEAMVADRDKLESRIVDIEKWLERNETPELRFLLGYLYYQLGRFEEALESIRRAYEEMPDSRAVLALKAVIEDAAK